jgi:hypothetical protein
MNQLKVLKLKPKQNNSIWFLVEKCSKNGSLIINKKAALQAASLMDRKKILFVYDQTSGDLRICCGNADKIYSGTVIRAIDR